MSKRKKCLYPGVDDAEMERMAWKNKQQTTERPDFIGGAPNYDKYPGISPEQVLVWLNID